MRCLIANDDVVCLIVLEALFEKYGFEVTTAINGHLAYEKVLNANEMFDLIVLDLSMPVSDGFEACKLILQVYSDTNLLQRNISSKRQSFSKPYDYIPYIVGASGYVDANVYKKCKDVGFEDLFEMPIDAALIEEVILPRVISRLS